MIVFKPRLAAFYVILFVTIALLSNRITVHSLTASAQSKSTTIVESAQ